MARNQSWESDNIKQPRDQEPSDAIEFFGLLPFELGSRYQSGRSLDCDFDSARSADLSRTAGDIWHFEANDVSSYLAPPKQKKSRTYS